MPKVTKYYVYCKENRPPQNSKRKRGRKYYRMPNIDDATPVLSEDESFSQNMHMETAGKKIKHFGLKT